MSQESIREAAWESWHARQSRAKKKDDIIGKMAAIVKETFGFYAIRNDDEEYVTVNDLRFYVDCEGFIYVGAPEWPEGWWRHVENLADIGEILAKGGNWDGGIVQKFPQSEKKENDEQENIDYESRKRARPRSGTQSDGVEEKEVCPQIWT